MGAMVAIKMAKLVKALQVLAVAHFHYGSVACDVAGGGIVCSDELEYYAGKLTNVEWCYVAHANGVRASELAPFCNQFDYLHFSE